MDVFFLNNWYPFFFLNLDLKISFILFKEIVIIFLKKKN